MLDQIPSLLLALLFFFFAYISFGSTIVKKLGLSLTALETVLVGTILAMSVITAAVALLGLVIGPFAYGLVVLAAGLGLYQFADVLGYYRLLGQGIARHKILFFLAGLSIVAFSSTIVFSGFHHDSFVYYQETHDSSWHLALTNELTKAIPPAHPSYPAIDLTNYHYFYDVFLAGLVLTTGISSHLLYFQVMPIVLGALLVAAAFVLGRRMGGVIAGVWLVFFTLFVGSFAYFIPLFIPGQQWHESSFWVSQTFVMIVNPQIIFTLALTYVVLFFLARKDRLNVTEHLVLVSLIAISIGFKSYAWVILCVVYAFALIWESFSKKTFNVLFYLGLLGIASAPFVWLITGFKTGTFFFRPLWFVDSMVESADRLNFLQWKFLEDHYRLTNNWPRIIAIKTLETAIFYLGNVGVRILALFLPLVLFLQRGQPKKYKLLFLSLVGFIFSSVFPLLFLQTGVVWNSIQFWYYALLFLNVMAVFVVMTLWQRVGLWAKILLTILILSLSLPTTIKTFHQKMPGPRFEATALTALSHLSDNDRLLICPENNDLFNTTSISVYTPATVYVSMPIQLEIVGLDASPAVELQEIFREESHPKFRQLLDEQNITHILCSDQGMTAFVTKSIDRQPESIGTWSVFTVSE